MTNSIGEIRNADFLFVIGSNTTEAHPVIAMEMKRAMRRGATLVVADPRKIWLADHATRHLQLKPGTDVWLLNAMANVIVTEGLCDESFINGQTEGFDRVLETVLAYTPEEAENVTGISAEDIRWTARLYATTPKAGIYYTLGITEHSHGTDNVYALSNLVLMTGHLGKPSAGMNPLRGQNNVQGANDAGATPVFYPGYQRADDPQTRARYEQSWGVPLPSTQGLNLNEMMKKIGSKIKGLFVMGEDIVLSEPNVAELEERMKNLEVVIVQEIFPNETFRYADVVFPAACFAEKEGVFTNSERRVQRVRKAVSPPGEARADWEILVALARLCGADWSYNSAGDIYAEMAQDTEKFRGISHIRLDEEGGLQWPCPTSDHPGTTFLHRDGVLRGKGKFVAVDYRPSAEHADNDFPLVLSTGRTLYHYNAATQTRRAEELAEKQPEAFIEIHPDDATVRNITTGDWVRVFTRRGSVECIATVSHQVQLGSIWMPFHFAEARANLLTTDVGDPVTGTAEYKVCAANVVLVALGKGSAPFPGAHFIHRG
ncbi:MAG: molybdopterin-dependent oxidoreductase [Myxococcales bacterium]|nr:molybdopterin-dependent oxidoreductase [Myxococcales bacterium]